MILRRTNWRATFACMKIENNLNYPGTIMTVIRETRVHEVANKKVLP